MRVLVRRVVDWCCDNPRTALAAVSLALSIGTTSGAAWYRLLAEVQGHTVNFQRLEADQARIVLSIDESRRAAHAELRDFADAQGRWQDKSEHRDEVIADKLERMSSEIGTLRGLLQRFQAYQGWKFQPQPGQPGPGSDTRLN